MGYVIVMRLHKGNGGFPAPTREPIMEEVLLPIVGDFPNTEERRLLYAALTYARHRTRLLFDEDTPSYSADELRRLDVLVTRKPWKANDSCHLLSVYLRRSAR